MSYGVDSPVLYNLSGRFPVNLALNIRMGIPFILDEAEAGARAGDIIILSPEYHHFWRNCFEPFQCLRAISANPECIHFARELLTAENLFLGAMRIPAVLQVYFMEDLFPDDPEIQRINQHGDIIDEYQTCRAPDFSRVRVMTVSQGYNTWAVIRELNSFAEHCRERNVSVFFVYPPFSQTAYCESQQFITSLDSLLQSELDIPILNSPIDACYPDSFFYNSDYHLNAEGAQQRTVDLWEILALHLHI